MKHLFFSLFLLGAINFATAQSEIQTPQPGSALRVALMDGIRAAVEPELEQQVVFKVDHLAVKNGWAFMRGVPQKPDGTAVNYKQTKYQAAISEGMFDNNICALLQKRSGQWTVVDFVLGATDVPWIPWAKQYGAPQDIF